MASDDVVNMPECTLEIYQPRTAKLHVFMVGWRFASTRSKGAICHFINKILYHHIIEELTQEQKSKICSLRSPPLSNMSQCPARPNGLSPLTNRPRAGVPRHAHPSDRITTYSVDCSLTYTHPHTTPRLTPGVHLVLQRRLPRNHPPNPSHLIHRIMQLEPLPSHFQP